MFATLEFVIDRRGSNLAGAGDLSRLPSPAERADAACVVELRKLDTTVRLCEYRQSGVITCSVLNCPLPM